MKTQLMYEYYPAFSPPRRCSPAISRPAQLLPYTTQIAVPSPYAWYGVLAIGNGIHPSSDANGNNTGHRSFHPPLVAAFATPRLLPSNWHYPQRRADSNNEPQGFYTVQEIETHSLKDLEPPHAHCTQRSSRVSSEQRESRRRLNWMGPSA